MISSDPHISFDVDAVDVVRNPERKVISAQPVITV
jgi:hypothetical protein